MNNNLKAVIIATLLIVTGLGVMSSWYNSHTMRSIGGGCFTLGLFLMAYALLIILKLKK